MGVDSLYCGPKRKNGCQRKINGSRLSLLWAKKKKWVPEKNKWEATSIYFSLAPIFSFWPTVKRVDSHLFFSGTHFFFLAHSKESRLPFIFLWHPFFLFGPQ